MEERFPFLELVQLKEENENFEKNSSSSATIKLIDISKIVRHCFICGSNSKPNLNFPNNISKSFNNQRENIQTICKVLSINETSDLLDKADEEGLISELIHFCPKCSANLNKFRVLISKLNEIRSKISKLSNSISYDIQKKEPYFSHETDRFRLKCMIQKKAKKRLLKLKLNQLKKRNLNTRENTNSDINIEESKFDEVGQIITPDIDYEYILSPSSPHSIRDEDGTENIEENKYDDDPLLLENLDTSVLNQEGHEIKKATRKRKRNENRAKAIRPHVCLASDCNVKFKYKHSLENHINRFHKKLEKPYVCHWQSCAEAFVKPSQLSHHIKKIHFKTKRRRGLQVEDLICTECYQSFSSHEELTLHEKENGHESSSSTCKVCKRNLRDVNELRRHLSRQGGKCKKEIRPPSLKLTHDSYIDVTDPIKKYVCGICSKRYSKSTYLKDHINGEHLSGFICEICQKVFKCRISQKYHMRAFHPDYVVGTKNNPEAEQIQIKKHTCSFCNKIFGNPNTRRIHEYTHTKEYPFACKICGLGRSSESQLRIHMKTHSIEREFVCKDCGAGFKRKDKLKCHIKRVHEDSSQKPFLCDQCEKSFWFDYHLKRHKELMHSEPEKKFYCQTCDFHCVLKHNFGVHLKTLRHKALEEKLKDDLFL